MMNEQTRKLESVKKSFTKVKKVLKAISWIARVGMGMSVAGMGLTAAYQEPINAAISKSVQEGTGTFTVKAENMILNGIVNLDVDLQQLVERGEYAMTILIVLGISMGLLLILSIISSKLYSNMIVIEKSETPFKKEILSSFKQIFVLVSIMTALMADPIVLITVIVVFVCIYKLIEYGVTLQEEVDEIL